MKKKFTWFIVSMLCIALLVGCTAEKEKSTTKKLNEVNQHESLDKKTDNNTDNHDHDHDHTHNHYEDDDHNHDENHEHTHIQTDIYNGYFDDEQIQDRSLSDWEGDWQSVYPYLQDGTLDEVFEHKANKNSEKTFQDIKDYYEIGYQTATERIVIAGNVVTFYENGHTHQGEYTYDGYEILTYEKGNRGVRYIFKLTGEEKGVPKFIQFSDHIISPEVSNHFHLYWGDDRQALLEEVTHWPTYYPAHLDGHTIAHEMMAH